MADEEQERVAGPYIKQIWLDEITDETLSALDKAVRMSYYGHRLKDLIPEIAELRVQLWQGQSSSGLFVYLTKLRSYPEGKELELWAVGGRGWVKHYKKIHARVEAFAQAEGCRWISYSTDRKGWMKLQPEGFKKKSTLWMKEI